MINRCCLALTVLAASLGAQEPTSSGAFIVRLGRDTMSVERFVRTGNRIEGDLVRRSPSTHVVHYVMTTSPEGHLVSAEISTRKPDGTVTRSLSPQIPASTFVMLPESYAPYELWLSQMRRQKKDSADVVLMAPLGGPAGKLPVRMLPGDSVRAWFFGAPLKLRVDGSGRLLALDGRSTTLKYEVTRVPTVDVNAVAASFAERDAAGKPLGMWVSRRDTLRAQIGNANVWIDYGRPLTRGRDVFNRGVLGDTLWRTGANAATQFRTDKDLRIEGKILKAGTYSLWTSVSADNTKYALTFNSQTGQWGTEHHADRDVLTVPLKAERATLTEEFTISIDPTSPATMLTLSWGTLRLAARIDGVSTP